MTSISICRKNVLLGLMGLISSATAQTLPQEMSQEMPEQSLASTELIDELAWLQGETTQVTVASRNVSASQREAPGIVTIVTRQEIANSGARDLIDVLRLVPGFEFGVDLFNVVGIGMRGIQAHEGKVSVLIDGMEMNERRYANIPLGNHFPVEHIKRIEIIRGPGSVIYGGFAELGVINIITQEAQDIQGVRVSAVAGTLERGQARSNLNLLAGKQWDDLSATLLGFVGEGHRSDQIYTDFKGNSFDMAESNALEPSLFNLGIDYRGFKLHFLMDRYRVSDRDSFGEVLPTSVVWDEFNQYVVDLKSRHYLSDTLQLDTKLSYSHQSPWERWHFEFGDEAQLQDRVFTDRYQAQASTLWRLAPQWSLTLGGEMQRDTHKSDLAYDDPSAQVNATPTFTNQTAFVESLYQLPWLNITAGVRYDSHNLFGSHASPRLALTKAFDRFHYKLLYSHAFRTPTLENYRLNAQIEPETARTTELELGYQLTSQLSATVNLFQVNTYDTILYGLIDIINLSPQPRTIDIYYNAEKLATQGIEFEMRGTGRFGYVDANYAYYQVTDNTVAEFQTLNMQTGTVVKDSANLAFPTHKLTLKGHFKVNGDFSINPSVVFLSSRYAYTAADANGNSIISELEPTTLVNLFFRHRHFLARNLELGIGFYDLFNEQYQFAQPYNGGHPPLPGPGREIDLKLTYQLY